MSREQINAVALSIAGSLICSIAVFAGKGWFTENSKGLTDKVEKHELAITKIDATYTDIIRRLDRIEGKLDEITARPFRK